MTETPKFLDTPEYGEDLVARIFAAVREAYGPPAAPQTGESFKDWVERMYSEDVLEIVRRDDLKDLKTYQRVTKFVAEGGVVLDPDTGLSPFRGEAGAPDVSDDAHSMTGIRVEDRLAEYRKRTTEPLAGRVVV